MRSEKDVESFPLYLMTYACESSLKGYMCVCLCS